MSGTYWLSAADDEAMQEEHAFIWDAMLATIDVDLAGKRVLDVGCNRGGFLRLLTDRARIAQGFGYDPAVLAVEDARRLAGDRPLRFEASETVPAGWTSFDAAFSHEVLYLLDDLPGHACAIHDALVPGGVYFAVLGVHRDSPLMVDWHEAKADEIEMPELYDLDEVVAVFAAAGFRASAARLTMRFVPVEGRSHGERGRLLDWVDYYYDRKLLLRFERSR